ncbi:cold shock domain-containing protein [Candidatus Poribacteria bacterium]|nr:cold shock domain-containing protein [Candidatus Poribacteria bacterium]MYF54802.1 cold shock domain-containing protein [Candidatus Poribacteria bacterium]
MPTGRIKYFNLDKGFGFIAQDNSEEDVFLHSSAIKNADYEELRVGQRVKYIVVEGDRGLVAKNVEVLLTPTERRWLRQGKTIIPRGYSGFPNQNQDQYYGEERRQSRRQTDRNPNIESELQNEQTAEDSEVKTVNDTDDAKATVSRQLSFGDLYILKQINLETPMFFALYNHVQLPAIVLEMTLSGLTLNCNGEERRLQKTEIKYCYKDEDAENVKSLLTFNEEIKAKQLKPVQTQDSVYSLDTESIQESRQDGKRIEITLREGEVFQGTVDWISPYEIKLVLDNASKVVVFRHAICNFILMDKEE